MQEQAGLEPNGIVYDIHPVVNASRCQILRATHQNPENLGKFGLADTDCAKCNE